MSRRGAAGHGGGPLPAAPRQAFRPVLARHRFDALQDGVYAIALTLLVLELRLPGHEALHSSRDLLDALVGLLPRFVAWLESFFVLALFWQASLRAQAWVRELDGGLVWINILSLLFASFLPFASGLVGEHMDLTTAQCVFAAAMAGMALTALWQLRYITAHPELCHAAMPAPVRRAAMLRILGLLGTALLAMAIAFVEPRLASMSFALMGLIAPLSGRIERGGAR